MCTSASRKTHKMECVILKRQNFFYPTAVFHRHTVHFFSFIFDCANANHCNGIKFFFFHQNRNYDNRYSWPYLLLLLSRAMADHWNTNIQESWETLSTALNGSWLKMMYLLDLKFFCLLIGVAIVIAQPRKR